MKGMICCLVLAAVGIGVPLTPAHADRDKTPDDLRARG